jgi:hypothetical protein
VALVLPDGYFLSQGQPDGVIWKKPEGGTGLSTSYYHPRGEKAVYIFKHSSLVGNLGENSVTSPLLPRVQDQATAEDGYVKAQQLKGCTETVRRSGATVVRMVKMEDVWSQIPAPWSLGCSWPNI